MSVRGRERRYFLAYLILFFFGWWARVLFPLERQMLSIASGYLMKKTNSIWPSVTLHGVQNMIALLP
jgi:hypothetical protein